MDDLPPTPQVDVTSQDVPEDERETEIRKDLDLARGIMERSNIHPDGRVLSAILAELGQRRRANRGASQFGRLTGILEDQRRAAPCAEPLSLPMERVVVQMGLAGAGERDIEIRADARDAAAGCASHLYEVRSDLGGGISGTLAEIHFQHGPIKDRGRNGVTNEQLLLIVIDRLEGFQSGPYACVENADAAESIRDALAALRSRTRDRQSRGVEGTQAL